MLRLSAVGVGLVYGAVKMSYYKVHLDGRLCSKSCTVSLQWLGLLCWAVEMTCFCKAGVRMAP